MRGKHPVRASAEYLLGVCVSVALVASGCGDGGSGEDAYEIAVTNSYLEGAVRDLCGEDVRILCLAPPGMCPGHFDLSPAQVRQLQHCRMLLLFDFQRQVQQRLTRLEENGLKVQLISTPLGLCLPDTYMATCSRVCQALSRVYPEKAREFQERLSVMEGRLQKLAGELHSTVADSGAASSKALVSNHQALFAEWLGLEPVATFVGSDVETAANIDHCIRQAAGQDVRFVIANRQEGTALAEALADRLQARAVVFSNFPLTTEGIAGFDQLLRENVQRLVEAVE